MMRSLNKEYLFSSVIICLTLIITSCSSSKKVKYFQDIPDSGQLKTIPAAVYIEPRIQVDDILSVVILLTDPSASQMINSGNVAIASSTSAGAGSAGANGMGSSALAAAASSGISQMQSPSGYLVNRDGNIEVPVLGKIHAVGHTTSELKDTIQAIAEKYYNDPTVIVRYANFKINITGEVLKPGVYIMPNEKVSILDALAMAGDLTIFGKRENVLLIRENPDGTKTPYRINLKKSDIMSAPYYYMRQNDVIYVEPRKAKSDATDAAQAKYVTIAGALLSIILVLAYRAN